MPRFLHKLYAHAVGYFWLPCPICGRMYGGHEIANVHTAAIIGDDGKARVVCPDPMCSYEAGVRNTINGHSAYLRPNIDNSRQTQPGRV
jgi:hypothetical protein